MNHEQSNHRNMHSLKIHFHSSPFTNEKKKGELVHIFINAIKTLTFVIVNGEGCKFMRKKKRETELAAWPTISNPSSQSSQSDFSPVFPSSTRFYAFVASQLVCILRVEI